MGALKIKLAHSLTEIKRDQNYFSSDIKFTMEFMLPEILLDILERLDSKTLSTLCLVSKPMRNLSRPLLFRDFDGGIVSERCLKRLRNFSQQLLTDPSLASQVRSVNIGCIQEADIGELQDIFESLLKHTPNFRHLTVPGAQRFTKFLNNLLKGQDYLRQLQTFESSPIYGSTIRISLQCWQSIFGLTRLLSLSLSNCEYNSTLSSISPELQGNGDLLLRRVCIENRSLGYTILARLIQSCKRLETFIYVSPSRYHPEDSDPATIIRALLLHKNSLKHLTFDFCSRDEDEDFNQARKLESLEEFSCLERLYVNQDCLPWKPLLPPSLKLLGITSPDEPLEPNLFHNLGIASHLSLKLLSELYVTFPLFEGYPEGIFDGFDDRVYINID
ncbi:hypothetical protein BDW59DRAFT_155624 [Aspergillus cavernicola]|uniref:F-box domain-containing protein n=1 Tax=Aspergillus cavernicola TaxID=176166 RepID=A0ABR4H531_9EURO